jgi:hypothetical protein
MGLHEARKHSTGGIYMFAAEARKEHMSGLAIKADGAFEPQAPAALARFIRERFFSLSVQHTDSFGVFDSHCERGTFISIETTIAGGPEIKVFQCGAVALNDEPRLSAVAALRCAEKQIMQLRGYMVMAGGEGI